MGRPPKPCRICGNDRPGGLRCRFWNRRIPCCEDCKDPDEHWSTKRGRNERHLKAIEEGRVEPADWGALEADDWDTESDFYSKRTPSRYKVGAR